VGWPCSFTIISQPTGPRGANGWAPVITYGNGDSGVGLYITDWIGGVNPKPPVGLFVGPITIGVGVYAPVPAPDTPSSGAVQYFDEADNILKIKFSDGSILEMTP